MSKVLPKRNAAPNPGPYLKTASGDNILTVTGLELQTTEILDSTYLQDQDGRYVFDSQPDSPVDYLTAFTGYPIQQN